MAPLSVEDRITKAHIALMQHKETLAYSGLLMVGKVSVVDDEGLTAATNGRDIKYGKSFIESLNDAELRGLILHETKHKMYQHLILWRALYKEDPTLANQSCDYVINLELDDLRKRTQGFVVLPEGGLLDEKYRGLDSAEVFKLLKKDGDSSGGSNGSPLDTHEWEQAEAMSELEKSTLIKEISSAVRTGAMLAGKQGGELDRSFEAVMESKVDWKEQLREFVSSICAGKDESTWAKPNRRWLQQDIYLPSTISTSVGKLVVAIDTSGSIEDAVISQALSELVAICDNTSPECVELLYWDHKVACHEQYREGEYTGLLASTKPKGGGGTDVNVVFEYIENHKLTAQCVIIITDGYTPYPRSYGTPVVWVVVGGSNQTPPFGGVIRI
jgi:predicted metal-dependent peptidase